MTSRKIIASTCAGVLLAFGSLTLWAQEADSNQQNRQGNRANRGERGERAQRGERADRGDRAARREARTRVDPASQEFRIAVMSYTFNRFTLFEAIDKTKKAGAQHIETFSWQKLSPEHGDLKFEPTLPPEARSAVKKKLADTGVKLVGYYFHELKDEATSRPVFAFCKDMGMEYIVSEPDPKNLPMLDKLAQEYQVKLAVHNHPKSDNKPEYTYWRPEGVLEAIEGCSSWVGCCADNGHWVRSGLDPVESIRKYHGRLISMHLKDVNKVGSDAHDVPYGTGVVRMKDLLAAVQRMGFSGVFSIEYEHNMEDNQADVAQCVEYFNQAKAQLGVK